MITIYVYDHGVRLFTYRFKGEGFDSSYGPETIRFRGTLESGEKKELTLSSNAIVIKEKDLE